MSYRILVEGLLHAVYTTDKAVVDSWTLTARLYDLAILVEEVPE